MSGLFLRGRLLDADSDRASKDASSHGGLLIKEGHISLLDGKHRAQIWR